MDIDCGRMHSQNIAQPAITDTEDENDPDYLASEEDSTDSFEEESESEEDGQLTSSSSNSCTSCRVFSGSTPLPTSASNEHIMTDVRPDAILSDSDDSDWWYHHHPVFTKLAHQSKLHERTLYEAL